MLRQPRRGACTVSGKRLGDPLVIDRGLFVPSNLAAVVAKVVCEPLPSFGHSTANPTNPSALLAQVSPYSVFLALGSVHHRTESITAGLVKE
jgi:hypothetical protein